MTPLGASLDATWNAIDAGAFVTDRGVVPIPRDGRPRVEQLATIAALAALGDARDADLFVGTSKGPADQWLFDNHVGGYGLATLADGVAASLGLRGDRHTSSAACASGLHALAFAVMRMRFAGVARALVVAAESSLHGIWSATFRRLGVLAPPGEPCRPFDADARGFVIGEAAAAIVLERRAPRTGEVTLDDARIAGDAYHLTGSDPDGRALRHLLATLAGDDAIDLVHAHATATVSDAIELAAIDAALGRCGPRVWSHKGAVGHTLGASGLLAVALTHRAMRDGRLPAHATTRRTIDAGRCRLSGGDGPIRTAICCAGGFGGAAAAARLSRVELASEATVVRIDGPQRSGV